jgi:hypothetical protein
LLLNSLSPGDLRNNPDLLGEGKGEGEKEKPISSSWTANLL